MAQAIKIDPMIFAASIAPWWLALAVAITVPGTAAGTPTITIPGVTNALSVNQAYQYDALDRLTSVIPGKVGATTAAAGLALLPKEV